MLNTKKLDITQLVKGNNKFLEGAGGKLSWQSYENCLANERETNSRLQEVLRNKNDINKLLEEGRKCTYTDYAAQSSNFRLDGRKSAFGNK